jgi:hypothetical protein
VPSQTAPWWAYVVVLISRRGRNDMQAGTAFDPFRLHAAVGAMGAPRDVPANVPTSATTPVTGKAMEQATPSKD